MYAYLQWGEKKQQSNVLKTWTSEGHLEYRSGLLSGNDGARGLLAHTNTEKNKAQQHQSL